MGGCIGGPPPTVPNSIFQPDRFFPSVVFGGGAQLRGPGPGWDWRARGGGLGGPYVPAAHIAGGAPHRSAPGFSPQHEYSIMIVCWPYAFMSHRLLLGTRAIDSTMFPHVNDSQSPPILAHASASALRHSSSSTANPAPVHAVRSASVLTLHLSETTSRCQLLKRKSMGAKHPILHG